MVNENVKFKFIFISFMIFCSSLTISFQLWKLIRFFDPGGPALEIVKPQPKATQRPNNATISEQTRRHFFFKKPITYQESSGKFFSR